MHCSASHECTILTTIYVYASMYCVQFRYSTTTFNCCGLIPPDCIGESNMGGGVHNIKYCLPEQWQQQQWHSIFPPNKSPASAPSPDWQPAPKQPSAKTILVRIFWPSLLPYNLLFMTVDILFVRKVSEDQIPREDFNHFKHTCKTNQ